jgi:hypothetical protein
MNSPQIIAFLVFLPFMIYSLKVLRDGEFDMGSFGHASIADTPLKFWSGWLWYFLILFMFGCGSFFPSAIFYLLIAFWLIDSLIFFRIVWDENK